MIAHTPGPWRTDGQDIYACNPVPGEQWRVAENLDQVADAKHIVRCVNAHDDLLAALREIADGCISRRPGHFDYHLIRTKAEIESVARAAIAKATA